MEVETGARKHALSDPTITGYVGPKVWKWRLEEQLQGTAGLALVLSTAGSWATPDPVKTSRFPILVVDCYADPDRNDAGEITVLNAADKAKALWLATEKLWHGKRDQMWGGPSGIRVVSSARWSEPVLFTHAKSSAIFGEEDLGDTVFWRGQYALQVG